MNLFSVLKEKTIKQWNKTQSIVYRTPDYRTFFQMGTRLFSSSMAHSVARMASVRWGDAVAMITDISPTATWDEQRLLVLIMNRRLIKLLILTKTITDLWSSILASFYKGSPLLFSPCNWLITATISTLTWQPYDTAEMHVSEIANIDLNLRELLQHNITLFNRTRN